MIRKAVYGGVALVLLVVCAASGGLLWAHRSIRAHRPVLPNPDDLLLAASAGGPLRLAVVNTASQTMPRAVVLDRAQERGGEQPYVMSHPSFVLEWEDGRILLIDAGMTRQGAVDFGGSIELVGGEAIEAHGSVAEQLGAARRRVQAVIFTHLHLDHVGGITELCADRDDPLRIPMTAPQAERPNYTTRGSLALVHEAPCTVPQVLAGDGPVRVPGFPGVAVATVAGHTPGSQVVVARLQNGGGTYVFVGDIANHIDGINDNIPKPFLYRFLVVPEDEAQLARLRRLVRDLRERHGAVLLLAHDQLHLQRSGVPGYTAPP